MWQLRVGGFEHKITWNVAEKSVPWKDNEPNGGDKEDCAEYVTGAGLNGVICRAKSSQSRVLCRRPPANIEALRAALQPATSSSSCAPSWTLSGSSVAFCLLFFSVIVFLFLRLRSSARKVTELESSLRNAAQAPARTFAGQENSSSITGMSDTYIYDYEESVNNLGPAQAIPTSATTNTATAAPSPAIVSQFSTNVLDESTSTLGPHVYELQTTTHITDSYEGANVY